MIQRNRHWIASAAFCLVTSACTVSIEAQQGPSADAGEQVFIARCSGCHGLDGRGGEHAPNIATNERVQALSGAQILGIVRKGKVSAGMPEFGSVLDEGQLRSLLVYLRILQGKHETAKLPGNVESGRALFFGRARCADCHMMSGKGGFMASDLTSFGRDHSIAEIRAAIVRPDQRSGIAVVKTKDGRSYQGIIRNEDNFSLQMQAENGMFYFFDKADIERVEYLKQPLMPANYGSRLEKSELDDLVSYIATGSATGNASNKESQAK